MESKHTPGPWYVDTTDKEHQYSVCTDDAHGWGIAEVQTFAPVGTDAANAALIAAAPDMYEALLILLAQKPYREGDGAAMYHAENIARRALAKAEGR